jgi:uncharacterized metal-binding protein (TIGR02443 family)
MPIRFIAGAVCPACGVVDRIVVEGDLDNRLRRCVECNFRETLSSRSSVSEPAQSARADAALPDAVDAIRLVTGPGRDRSAD